MSAQLRLVPNSPEPWPESLLGGSEMGRRIREFDWSSTALGPVGEWLQSLRSYVGMLVSSSIPVYLFWRDEGISLYNDAFLPIAGDKHPNLLGLPAAAAWPEVDDALKPLLREVRENRRPITLIDQHFAMARYGSQEEFYTTVAYSPLHDEQGAVAGVLATMNETTQTVLAHRRIETLRDLAARSATALTERESCAKISAALANNADLPFGLLYLRDGASSVARLALSVGVTAGDAAAPLAIDVAHEFAAWPVWAALDSGRPAKLENVRQTFEDLPGGPWPESPHTALILPIAPANQPEAIGVLIAGLSPRLRLDEPYREFVTLAASQIADIVAGARAFEAEQKRANMLSELDLAKTTFFSNVSHEFRTPLTLMLGPLQATLSEDENLNEKSRANLAVVQRNALRLQKLVNALLDFSHDGRERAHLVVSDIAELTANLAAEFRPVIEAAGLRYVVDITELACAASVDREMWSTIVLNLLSNALKYTFEGEIRVELRRDETSLELLVSDTGVGISATELPRIFERFHRIAGTRSRTHEGSGIGLALVYELVNAHGGEITVESEPGRGTTFGVTLRAALAAPNRAALRLAPGTTASAPATRALAFLEEARDWNAAAAARLPAVAPASAGEPQNGSAQLRELPCVVVADDNVDMRDYVAQVLAPHYRVIAVPDGARALAAVRAELPDLVLTDVMMPVLDGFGLLREIRQDPALAALPVIMLSARASEDASVEGFEHGADDYVVKPFTVRELLARVRANIDLARLRREFEREHRVADLFQRASLPIVLPTVPGLSFDAVYVPGNSDAQVGGDWYDALRLVDGRVVISIGDVAGSGVAAAVTMGNMRQIIRGIAQVHADPVLMLNAADRALRLEHPDVFVTAFVGVLDPITRTLTYASAGHPPPYMRLPSGELESLRHTGLPLGLRYGQIENTTSTADLHAGSLLVLYTDGLTEATRDLALGERLLESALQSADIVPAAHPALALRQAVLAETKTDDDIAILTVRIDPLEAPEGAPAQVQRWTFDATDAAAAQAARRTLGRALQARGASLEDVYDAEMVVGELIGNIVRYAPGVAELSVDWTGPLPVLHVLDRGPGFRHIALLPNDPYSESGRGLFLVATLTEDFNVRRRPGGGSHACAVLSLERSRLGNVSRSDAGGIFLDALMRTY